LKRNGSRFNPFLLPARRALLLLAVGLIVVVAGFGDNKKRKALPPPPADLPGHVNYLVEQLHGVMLEDAGAITDEIQKLVLGHLQEWMAHQTPSAVDVRRELETVFSGLHYPSSGEPATFAQTWNGQVVIGAGYTLGWTDYDRANVLAIFSSRLGQSHLVTVTNFVPRTDMHYTVLDEPNSDVLRFFAYGYRLGASQPRLSVVFYSFDGKDLKSLWESRDIYDGKITIGKDAVVIRYLREDEYIREQAHGRNPSRYRTLYAITPAGLEVRSDETIPF